MKRLRPDGAAEFHAARFNGQTPPNGGRDIDGDADDEEFHMACLLAKAVGVELEQ